MLSYYHRAGRQVPVHVSTCAFIVPRPLAELGVPAPWRPMPLARRHSLVVRTDLGVHAPTDRSAVLLAVLTRARSGDRGDAAVERPTPDAIPILVPPTRPLMLCPTGAVVARFPPTRRGDIERRIADRGWDIERPVRFLESAFVLRSATEYASDPLTLANELVERFGCRFAHPVLLEEVVRAD